MSGHRLKGTRKRKQAELRQQALSGLTPGLKLKRLDAKLGEGVGAIRERERLKKQRAQRRKMRQVGPEPSLGVD